MSSITAQEIVEILEARYAELTEFLESEGPEGDYDQITDFQSRINELETVLYRIDTFKPPQVEPGSQAEADLMLSAAEKMLGLPITFVDEN